jgi:hypothetical protein
MQTVAYARRTGENWLITQMPFDVNCQLMATLVSAGSVLLQCLHHYPVQIPADNIAKLSWLCMATFGNLGQVVA